MRGRWELSDAQWQLIELILQPKRRSDGRGRPWQETRAVLNGILWILGTGAQWRELPKKYPPYQTCHRRFQQWVREGKLERILRVLAKELHARGKLQLEEAFIDASFTGAKKGGLAVGPTRARVSCHGRPRPTARRLGRQIGSISCHWASLSSYRPRMPSFCPVSDSREITKWVQPPFMRPTQVIVRLRVSIRVASSATV